MYYDIVDIVIVGVIVSEVDFDNIAVVAANHVVVNVFVEDAVDHVVANIAIQHVIVVVNHDVVDVC